MSKSLLSNIVIFTAGAAIGSVVTWKLVKTKYEQIAQEEIESVREVYFRAEEEKEITEESEDEDEPDETEEYENIVENAGYKAYELGEEEKKTVEKEEHDDMIDPYVIEPDEFGDDDIGYETESLDYYEGDGVLTDAYGNVIENAEELVGAGFASHFGDYGERDKDTVFVRNDNLETDFEILRDQRSFSEVE